MSGTEEYGTGSMDLEKLLEQKAKLEGLIQQKFTKCVTVMVTDMHGSTAIAESEGDLSSRMLIKDHNEIVFPAIRDNGGVLVKSMGDGTLSYFNDARDALRTAVSIQMKIEEYNTVRMPKIPIRVRVGLHTGVALIEKNDIFGDVVNTASRFESTAAPGEINLSESTYNALEGQYECPCLLVGETRLKGKSELFKVYKAFWMPGGPTATQVAAITASAEAQKKSEPPAGATATVDPGLVEKARQLQDTGEAVQLFMLCEDNAQVAALADIRQSLTDRLKHASPLQAKFFNKEALWFFKGAMTIGRVKDADFPLTNRAVSRSAVVIGMRNGNAYLKVSEHADSVEVETPMGALPVRANVECDLGKGGRVVFAKCFPLEYKVYRDRFLVLRLSVMEDKVRELIRLPLAEVWKNHADETSRLIILGE